MKTHRFQIVSFILISFSLIIALSSCASTRHHNFVSFENSLLQIESSSKKILSKNTDWEKEIIIEKVVSQQLKISDFELKRIKKYEVDFGKHQTLYQNLKSAKNTLNKLNQSTLEYALLLTMISSGTSYEAEHLKDLASSISGQINSTSRIIQNAINNGNTSNNSQIEKREKVVTASTLGTLALSDTRLRIKKKKNLKKILKSEQEHIETYGKNAVELINIIEETLYHSYAKRFFLLEEALHSIPVKDKKRMEKRREIVEATLSLNEQYLDLLETLKTLKKSYELLPQSHLALYHSLSKKGANKSAIKELVSYASHLFHIYSEISDSSHSTDFIPVVSGQGGSGASGNIKIAEVIASPTESEKVVIKNESLMSVDISSWTISDKSDVSGYIIPKDTVLLPGKSLTIEGSKLGFRINDSGETIFLKNNLGQIISTWRN